MDASTFHPPPQATPLLECLPPPHPALPSHPENPWPAHRWLTRCPCNGANISACIDSVYLVPARKCLMALLRQRWADTGHMRQPQGALGLRPQVPVFRFCSTMEPDMLQALAELDPRFVQSRILILKVANQLSLLEVHNPRHGGCCFPAAGIQGYLVPEHGCSI